MLHEITFSVNCNDLRARNEYQREILLIHSETAVMNFWGKKKADFILFLLRII
jgi:hypothetical protein